MTAAATFPPVLLASASPYRRELLSRLLADFRIEAQHADERRLPGETPAALALRLARVKAESAFRRHPEAIVIGSDQVAALGQETLGKPGSAEAAVEQLLRCSGQSVEFLTGVCVLGPAFPTGLVHLDVTRAQFRSFGRDEAERYVAADQPLDCAGAIKVERRGVVLLERLDSADPSAIQGLPLIWLAGALVRMGVPLLTR